jgi:hypothetical protein
MLISFFNYVAQRTQLPSHAKCNAGWESAYANKHTPLRFALRHHDIPEGDFLHYFTHTVPNATAVLQAWPAYKHMQQLPIEHRVVLRPWIENFPRERYLKYLSTGSVSEEFNETKVFPERYRCEKYVEASVLLLERYAVVGTLEKLSDMYHVLYARAQVKKHVNVSHVTNPSIKVMPVEVERQVKALLKETMFCQSLMWRMAGVISDHDMACVSS